MKWEVHLNEKLRTHATHPIVITRETSGDNKHAPGTAACTPRKQLRVRVEKREEGPHTHN